MLQKLENVYLAILRFVVIVIAGALLVAVVVFGLNALNAVKSEPVQKTTLPHVSESELINSVTAPVPQADAKKKNKKPEASVVDDNMVFYEKIANTISEFAQHFPNGVENGINKDKVVAIMKDKAEAFDDPELTTSFAKNFADVLEKTLTNESVIEVTLGSSALDVINKSVNGFEAGFKAQVEKAKAEQAEAQQEYLEKKQAGLQSFYMAGGLFGAFLLIVFLSIVIKIERNLRPSENRAAGVAQLP